MAVADVNGKSLDVEGEARSEAGLAGRVGVAVNRLHRRDRAELDQDGVARRRRPREGSDRRPQGGEKLRAQRPCVSEIEADDHPANLYPIPWTVRMNCGWRGLGSIFWRSHATWTSTVRVDGIEL